MSDDLKVAVVIEALLNAKGFEDAQAGIRAVAGAANAAKGPVAAAGEATRRMGESFGGSRGPVADLTRVLLINIGATRGAGEAAKFAGAGLTALEAGAAGATLPLIGLTAGIALLLPMLIEWLTSTEDQTKEQKALKEEIDDVLPMLQAYARASKDIAESARLQLAQSRHETIKKEKEEMDKLAGAVQFGKEALDRFNKTGLGPGQDRIDQWDKERGRLMDLEEAQRKGISVEELYTQRVGQEGEAHKTAADAARSHQDYVDSLLDVERKQTQERLDAKGAAIDFAEQQEKDAQKDIENYGKGLKTKLKADTAYQLAVAKMKREEAALDAQVAELKVRHAAVAVAGVGATLGALSSIFGRNKALAIAAATADAISAGLQVFKDPFFIGRPWERGIAMAATIATGLAQVQNIRKSGEGVGFDDPFSDMVARKLGRQSATDFVKYFGGEFMHGMAGMGAQSVTNYHRTNINRGTTIDLRGQTINGVIGGKMAVARAQERQLRRAERVRRRTTLGR